MTEAMRQAKQNQETRDRMRAQQEAIAAVQARRQADADRRAREAARQANAVAKKGSGFWSGKKP